MCGIAGLICHAARCSEEDHTSLVRRMCDLQAHRGPDDDGVISLGNVCLGAVRLSIIDLTRAGHMPMSDEDGDWWIAYNGEIYNFEGLRKELIGCGHTFRSKTDTEVVLHAFKEWGEACLDRFVGMFAFAVYDRGSGTVTLVRDRFGIKPLYYMQHEEHLVFASELKALTAVNNRLRLNKQSLLEWSLYRNVEILSSETLLEDIHSVLPGELVRIRQGKVSQRHYFFPPSRVDPQQYERFSRGSPESVVESIEATLVQSTRDRLVSDVPVGTLCSGGLDSSLVTAIAARDCKGMTAFNVSISGYPELDEKRYAKEVAKALGIRLISYPLTGETFLRELPEIIYCCDLPLTHPNSVAYFLIAAVARRNGVIVLLSGEGADELFGGYRFRYRRHGILLRVNRILDLLPRKIRRALQMAAYSYAGMPATSLHFDSLLPQTVSFIDNWSRAEWRLQCEEAYSFVSNAHDRALLGTLLNDLDDFLTPLLRRLDRTTMANSIECRVPFLDHRLVEKAIQLPLSYRLGRRSDKWVLQQIAAKYLPRSIAQRKKVGFPLPLRDYLAPLARTDLFDDGFCKRVLGIRKTGIQELVALRDKNIFAFFNLLTLEIWGRLFFLDEPVERVRGLVSRADRKELEWEEFS